MIGSFVNGAAQVAGQHAGKRLGQVFDAETGEVHVYSVGELRREVRSAKRQLARVKDARKGQAWGPIAGLGAFLLAVLALNSD
jgi:hypothetical protein